MGPNNLCYVTLHFFFSLPTSHVTFYSFYKRLKVDVSHFFFYPCMALTPELYHRHPIRGMVHIHVFLYVLLCYILLSYFVRCIAILINQQAYMYIQSEINQQHKIVYKIHNNMWHSRIKATIQITNLEQLHVLVWISLTGYPTLKL